KKMGKRIVWLILWLSTSSLVAQDVTGAWGGTLDIQGTHLRVVFNVSQGPQGYTATMDSPDQGVKDIPVAKTTVDDSTIALEVPIANISYKGIYKDSLI